MTAIRFLNIFKGRAGVRKSGRFSEFFLHAPEDKKKEVLMKAAQKANEDQREAFRRSSLELNTR